MKPRIKAIEKFLIIFFGALFTGYFVFGAVMQSDNYQIEFDSINMGGGYSTSASYMQEGSIGEVGSGYSDSETYGLYAGYQQSPGIYIAITPVSSLTLAPDLGYLTGGTANGSTTLTAKTDNILGYTLSIKAGDDPAMQCVSGGCNPLSDNIADYTPSGSDPDYAWDVGSNSEFGYTVEGDDIVQKFKNSGSSCNSGSSDDADACWWYLQTSEETIASASAKNNPDGTATTIKFRAQTGAKTTGRYAASLSVTATTK